MEVDYARVPLLCQQCERLESSQGTLLTEQWHTEKYNLTMHHE